MPLRVDAAARRPNSLFKHRHFIGYNSLSQERVACTELKINNVSKNHVSMFQKR
jgi:hypothetical protein